MPPYKEQPKDRYAVNARMELKVELVRKDTWCHEPLSIISLEQTLIDSLRRQ
jgi:hypothetical protein